MRVLPTLATLCVLAIGAILAMAAPSDYYGKPIQELVLVPRRQPMPLDEFVELVGVNPGTTLTPDLVREIIRKLYATGRFEQVNVEAELVGQDAVQLRISTQHKWFIGNVSVIGVKAPPSAGELQNATKLQLGAEFSQRDEDAAVAALESMLERNGFYGAEVLPVRQYFDLTQQVNIAFYIQTPKRARYGRPIFQGPLEFTEGKLIGKSNWQRWWGLRGWKEVTESRTQSGISRIRQFHQRNHYMMARVRLLDMNFDPRSNEVHPSVDVQPGSRVEIGIEGAKLSQGKREQLIPVYEEQSVDRDLLVEGARNMEEYFQTRGYFNAEVNFEDRGTENDRQRIVYQINQGERKKLVNVEITGNEFFSEADIKERLYVTPASFQFRRGRLSEGYLRRDVETIKNLYLTNGFRDVEVTYDLEDPYKGKQGEIGVRFIVNEGPQVFVGSLQLLGVEDDEREEINLLLTTLENQPFSIVNATADRDIILSYFYDRGYPDAIFDFRILQTDSENLVDVVYEVKRGEQTFVREVLISGLQATSPELVHKRVEIFQGEPLAQRSMVETQRKLYDLGIFAKVDMAVQNPAGDENAKYVLFQLEESKRYSTTFGFGAELARIGGSSANLRSATGAATFSPRVQFEITRLNMFGNAHSLSFRSRVSNIQQRALVNYLAPQFRDRDNLNLAFTVMADQSRDVRTFTSRRYEGSLQLGQRINIARNVLYRVAWRQTGIDEGSLQVDPGLIPVFATPAKVGIISATLIEDKRDDPTDSTRGIYTSLDFGVASKALFSGADFGRFLGRNSTYHRINSKLVIARTTTFGLLEPLTGRFRQRTGFNIPLPERFFAGGAVSHRGFPENQAGPRDSVTGFPIGGDMVLVNGVEARFPLFGESLGGVLFHDAGNVYQDMRKFSLRFKQRDVEDFNYTVHAVGFGIRYQTPIGPFRVDLAYTINPPSFVGFRGTREELIGLPLPELLARREQQSVGRFQFHFSLGQSF
jgi:outer membrane protein insertion porin family